MKRFLCAAVIVSSFAANAVVNVNAQTRGRRGMPAVVCGDPTVRCRTENTFEPHDLPFRLPPRAVIYETEFFYAIVLKSIRAGGQYGDENCDVFVPERERLAAQRLFPRHKVFASRCPEAGSLYYTTVSPTMRFMAVYAGRTRAEAEQMLAQVQATNQFNGANLRRMRAGFNGT
ncbi:MAG: hypothetical protein WKF74_11940 [Pyrinomonadaceae bacterium]